MADRTVYLSTGQVLLGTDRGVHSDAVSSGLGRREQDRLEKLERVLVRLVKRVERLERRRRKIGFDTTDLVGDPLEQDDGEILGAPPEVECRRWRRTRSIASPPGSR